MRDEKKKKITNSKYTFGLVQSAAPLVWSTLFCVLNVYTLISVILWFSVDGLPTGSFLYMEVIVEFLLLLEIMLRIIFRLMSKKLFEKIPFFHVNPNDSMFQLIIVLIATVPQQTIYSALEMEGHIDLKNPLYSYLMSVKLLRSHEIVRYIDRLQERLFYKTSKALIFMKFIQNTFMIMLITHFASSAWLFIQKIQPDVAVDDPKYTNELNPFKSGT